MDRRVYFVLLFLNVMHKTIVMLKTRNRVKHRNIKKIKIFSKKLKILSLSSSEVELSDPKILQTDL